jgi:uncharacterized Zn-finger protein
VGEAAAAGDVVEVVCPHCDKAFAGELLTDGDGHQQGLKCPHCRLFVPLERAGDPDAPPESA